MTLTLTLRRALAGVASVGLLAGALMVLTAAVPTIEAVRDSTRGSEAMLLDRHGEPLQRLRMDRSKRQLDWVALDGVSPALIEAILVSEDRRFWRHPGVDPIALVSAARDNLDRTRARGASTLSMQLASLLANATPGREPRGIVAKLAQMRLALAIEARWDKRDILEAYLNLVGFRGELQGIGAASRGLFAKSPAGLDQLESAILASLVRAPGADATRLAKRACAVLRETADASRCAEVALTVAGLSGLSGRRYRVADGASDAPHLARRMLRQPGETVRSSVDRRLQRFAREVLRQQLMQLSGRNVEDGAVVVLDNRSGEVLAYVGSSGDLSDAPEVDGIAALRQPGSTLKPFLYALAIEGQWLTAASLLDDSPVSLTTPSGLYIPQNYDRDFKGPVSLRTALGASLNVPAVRTLSLVGLERFHERLRALGFKALQHDAGHYGYGLALGGAEIDLLSLTNAYRALANGGQFSETSTAPRAAAPATRVFSPEASFVVADVPSDPGARALTFGFASALSTRVWTAVKTGTSKAMRDNWAIGFSDHYTVGVWVGNFSGEPMWDVSGVSGAAPVWRAVIEYLHSDAASRAPTPPVGVTLVQVTFEHGVEASRREWFIVGTETARIESVPAKLTPRLVAPAGGAVIAIDPDIPRQRQALVMQARGAGARDCLWLDGAALGRCGSAAVKALLPMPGAHRLELRDSAGRTLDVASFEVRGLPRVVLGPR